MLKQVLKTLICHIHTSLQMFTILWHEFHQCQICHLLLQFADITDAL